jgi:hypothetical protein
MNKQTDLSNSLSFTKCLPQIPSGAVSNITKPTSTCDSPGPLSASSHQVCANSQRGATLQGLCTLPGSPTSPVTRVVQARLNLDDDVLLDWAEDTITAICERNTFRKWLLVRGLQSPITRADFFLTICAALHPQARLNQDPDFNLLLGFSYSLTPGTIPYQHPP